MVKQGYKQTEIGVIPEDWEVKFVKEFTDCTAGGTPNTQVKEYWNGNISWMNSGELNKKKVYNVDNSITELGYNNSSTKLIPEKCVLIGLAGQGKTRGTVAINFLELCINQSIGAFLPSKQYITEYLYYHLENKYEEIRGLSSGDGGRGGLNLKILKNIEIPLPSLAEQEAIAAALSDADVWIESLEQLMVKKRLIKQGAMQELLTLKKGWEVKKLGELCDVRDGTHDSPKYIDNGIKFITSKNIVNNKLDFSDINFISSSDSFEINKRSKVDKNDILMSMIGTIGNAVLIDFEPDFCIKNVALLKPKNIIARFLFQMIKSPYFQNLLNSKMDGGIQKFVSLGVLRDLDFNCPKSLSEQERIATILSDMDAELEALEKKIAKARQIKQGMMQELLTGRVRLV